jgi:hypothetical protein
MNFVSLVIHGLSAMAVHSDIVMLRLMIGTLALSADTVLGILAVVANVLNARSMKVVVPRLDAPIFVLFRRKILLCGVAQAAE